jgi:hypothetical protein
VALAHRHDLIDLGAVIAHLGASLHEAESVDLDPTVFCDLAAEAKQIAEQAYRCIARRRGVSFDACAAAQKTFPASRRVAQRCRAILHRVKSCGVHQPPTVPSRWPTRTSPDGPQNSGEAQAPGLTSPGGFSI